MAALSRLHGRFSYKECGQVFLHCGHERFGPFAHVVLAIPQQVQALVSRNVAFADALESVQMSGCHSLMLGYGDQETPDIDWDLRILTTRYWVCCGKFK